jgi:hypothetical protein
MTQSDLLTVADDVQTRLNARSNGLRFSVDRDHLRLSPANTLYVPVFLLDNPDKKNATDIIHLYEEVERESAARFHADVFVVPAKPYGD